MLLFSRVLTLNGNPRRTAPWAVAMTEYVNGHCDLDVSLWVGSYGYPLGTVAWSAGVESEADISNATAKLATEDGYFDLVDQGQEFAGAPGQDLLRELVHGEPGEPPPIGTVASITTATALVDQMTEAVGWGAEISDHVGKVTGFPVLLLSNVYGQMGELTWISGAPDMASAEAARAKINADPGYLKQLASTKKLFIPGSGQVSQVTRLA